MEKPKNMYTIMYYKNGNTIGMRESFAAKRQIMSFGGKHCPKKKVQLKTIAKTIQRMLNEGTDKATCQMEAKKLVEK